MDPRYWGEIEDFLENCVTSVINYYSHKNYNCNRSIRRSNDLKRCAQSRLPATTVRFNLPQPTAVSLSIYDLLEQRVHALILFYNEYRQAGNCSVM